MATSKLDISELDFTNVKANLKRFMSNQDEFKDYDFEGSTLSMLVGLLAYASHISAVNTNIAGSELFLDSAQIRKNVVSRANDLGFVPSSETASKAIVDIALSNVRAGYDIASFEIPKNNISAEARYIEVKAVSIDSYQFYWSRNVKFLTAVVFFAPLFRFDHTLFSHKYLIA